MKPVSSGEWVEVAERSLKAYSERTGTPVEEIDLSEALSSPDLEVVRDQPGVVLEAQLGLLYGRAEEAKDAFVRGVTALGIAAGSLAGRAFALKLPQDAIQSVGAWFNVGQTSPNASPPLSSSALKKLVDDVAALDTTERPEIPEGIEFELLFSLDNKDLVYGRSENRMYYLGRLKGRSHLSEFMSEHWVTIDRYNDESILQLKKFKSPEHILGNVDELVKDHPKVKAYWDELKKHPRFSPVTVFQADRQKLEREGGTQMASFIKATPTDHNQHMLAIRRACKFGVDYVVNFTKGRVHFVLDGIEDLDVVSKKGIEIDPAFPDYSPITSTELRSIYRNWDKVKHRVLFYRHGVTVDPPWEAEPELWGIYREHRENKYEKEAVEASQALTNKVDELKEKGSVREKVLRECLFHVMSQAAELINRGRYRDAISVMKKSTELMERLEDEGTAV